MHQYSWHLCRGLGLLFLVEGSVSRREVHPTGLRVRADSWHMLVADDFHLETEKHTSLAGVPSQDCRR